MTYQPEAFSGLDLETTNKLVKELTRDIGETFTLEEIESGDIWKVSTHDEIYKVFRNEEVAEKYAIKRTKDFIERQIDIALEQVSSGLAMRIRQVIDSETMQEWAEETVCMEGWQSEVAIYDGSSIDMDCGFIYCRI